MDRSYPFSFLFRLFFHLLYHQFAWSYDWVARFVSLGRWEDWVYTTLTYVQGNHVLELGHGPGHLQAKLLDQGLWAAGVDESSQMGRLAMRNLRSRLPSYMHHGCTSPRLIRALSQRLPFPNHSFDTIIATFPTRFIFDPRTLEETYRLLVPDGRLVIALSAWITGPSLLERAAQWLFTITGQAGDASIHLLTPLIQAGFEPRVETAELSGSRVQIILARRP